jgi:ABC-type transport system involved in multi-copper enzyme maturation permease subunit
MSLQRFGAVFGAEFGHAFRRPLFIILGLILALNAFGLSSGSMQISSGDSSVGGTKAWVTSEFAQTQMMTFIVLLYYAFFISIGAGLSLIRDHEEKVDSLLHSTPLTPGEYVWGRFAAFGAAFAVLMAWQVLTTAFFNHVVPNPGAVEIRGPFRLMNYLTPVLTIGIPFLILLAGVSMYLGEKSRSPVLVFLTPLALLLLYGFFLWTWSPSWLGPMANKLIQVFDPTGYRWLNETHLKVDRGVVFYNTQHVPYDGLFWLNRLWMLVVGLGAVLLTQKLVARSRRGLAAPMKSRKGAPAPRAVEAVAWEAAPAIVGFAGLNMRSSIPSFLRGTTAVAAAELRELFRQPGLYLFILLILVYALGNGLVAVGAFDTPILLTPGTTAVGIANQVSAFVLLLLMFYTVESHERERTTGLSQILYATPLKSTALLFGKALANSVVGALILLAALAACAIMIGIQQTVPFSLGPYFLIWGLLLVPTFLVWTAFITLVYALVGNRYATYPIALGVIAFTGFRALTRQINWAGNWPLWNALRWSDLGFFETDRAALIWNRIMVLGLAVFFTVLAVRFFGRRGADAVRTMHRLAPRRIAASAVRLLPFAVIPIVACIVLILQVNAGIGGGVAKKANKDYWAKNLKTWLDAPLPDIARADIKLKVDPPRHWLSSEGAFTLVNNLDAPLAQIPLTGGLHWKNLTWTLNGAEYKPEDSQHLYVFTPARPLANGDSVVIGWRWDGRFPDGVTKSGENTAEFVLPSGVVLTGFTPSFSPVLGYIEDVGQTKENRTEPRRYARDYWKGVTRGGYGATAWFPARISVTGPAEYTLNGPGVCTSNTVKDGWRTQVWETDHPIKMLNVICGRWKVKQGQGTTIYYHEAHPYNVDEMSSTLDAARRWYSEWFLPYPWRELKLSEFPGMAGYAQGFGTNITFSENIGFLTKNDAKTDATFLVTAHEAAHQWWGNILTPANGPNADILSEGASHFATMLLFDKVKGPRGRMEFAKGLEARYGDRRQVDEERPMYDVDGKKDSDETVIYDRGGWFFWMLYDFMGHDRALAGYRHFIETWSRGRDHPALQDFVATMRPFAADAAAFDAFVAMWLEDKAMPEYRFTEAKKAKSGDGYVVTVTVRNNGTGRMPVEIAATAGERWNKAKDSAKAAFETSPEYRDARATVTLGAGESRTATIHCPFEPERVVIDPDVRVLQLQRKQAVATL